MGDNEVTHKMIYLREYQKQWEEETESFNLSGFVREKLDEEVIPDDEIPEEYRPEATSGD
jgi:hypothetical protein